MKDFTPTSPIQTCRLIFTECPEPEDLQRFQMEKPESVVAKGPTSRVGWITMSYGTQAGFDELEKLNQDVRLISTTTDFNEGETWTQLVGESGNDFTARVHKLVRSDRLGPILVFADHYAQD